MQYADRAESKPYLSIADLIPRHTTKIDTYTDTQTETNIQTGRWQETVCCFRRREMLLSDAYDDVRVTCGQSAAETFVKMTGYLLTLSQHTSHLDNCSACKRCIFVMYR